ncbi:MAG TPA: dTMP kinase, partial [Anaerolineae bacterium]|nr:dTMP kinase [Anaerolineae bacterium]
MALFITFEGPEGSGKSTQLKLLEEWLSGRGHDVLATREPGGTSISEAVRSILLDPANTAMRPVTEILLFSAARAQIVAQVIRPHMERGGIVLCDRYADSTLAYQGYGRGLDLDTLRAITAFATGGLLPHLTVYLDIAIEDGLRRKSAQEWNRLEDQTLMFHRRVRQGYLEMAAAEQERWLVLDAAQPIAGVQSAIRER